MDSHTLLSLTVAFSSIKFVTDLIVFPLLWLYRLARLTKRKFLKMIGKGDREYPNGEQKPS